MRYKIITPYKTRCERDCAHLCTSLVCGAIWITHNNRNLFGEYFCVYEKVEGEVIVGKKSGKTYFKEEHKLRKCGEE